MRNMVMLFMDEPLAVPKSFYDHLFFTTLIMDCPWQLKAEEL